MKWCEMTSQVLPNESRALKVPYYAHFHILISEGYQWGVCAFGDITKGLFIYLWQNIGKVNIS